MANVQMGLWPDYLKKNCLEGPNYNLVAKIEKLGENYLKFTGTRILCCRRNSVL